MTLKVEVEEAEEFVHVTQVALAADAKPGRCVPRSSSATGIRTCCAPSTRASATRWAWTSSWTRISRSRTTAPTRCTSPACVRPPTASTRPRRRMRSSDSPPCARWRTPTTRSKTPRRTTKARTRKRANPRETTRPRETRTNRKRRAPRVPSPSPTRRRTASSASSWRCSRPRMVATRATRR